MSPSSGTTNEFDAPPTNILLDAFKKNPSAIDQLPMRKSQPRAVKGESDPITMHYLVETAINDSLDYEILSIDELDGLKKEQRNVQRHIETLKSKLQLEIKVRDSAQSLFSLFPDQEQTPPKRRSLLGSRKESANTPRSASYQKAREELAKSVKLCDELAREIWVCDKQQRDLEDRQLRHTAGVFQAQNQHLLQENAERQDIANGEEKCDALHDLRNGYDGIMEIPQRHSVLGRQMMNQQNDLIQQREALAQTEARLQDFHRRLHLVVAEYSQELLPREELEFYANDIPSAIFKHLYHMEQGLHLIERAPPRNADSEATRMKVRQLSNRMNGVLEDSVSSHKQPLRPQDPNDVESELTYLEEGLYALQEQQSNMHGHMHQLQSKGVNQDQEVQRCIEALHRLWDTLVSGEKRMRTSDGEDDSPFGYDAFDEDQEQGSAFSIAATFTKTQRLCERAARLSEQQVALRSQLEQERERSVKRGSTLGAERDQLAKAHASLNGVHNNLVEELHATREQHLACQKAYEHKRSQLDAVKRELNQAIEELHLMEERQMMSLKELSDAQAVHENNKRDLSSKLSARQEQIQDLQATISHHTEMLESERTAHHDLQASHSALSDEYRVTHSSFEKTKGELDSKISAQSAQIAELEGALASCAANLESAQTAYTDAQASRLQIRDELEQREVGLSELQISNAETQHALQEEQFQVRSLEGALASHVANLESMQSAYSDAEISRLQIRKELEEREDSLAELQMSSAETQQALQEAQSQIRNLEGALASRAANLESMQSAYSDAEISRLQIRGELDEREASIMDLQASYIATQQSLVEAQSRITQLTQTAAVASERAASLEALADTHASSLQILETEKAGLDAQVARLITDATMARAELDAAQGSRAQRAATTSPEMQKQLADLTARNADLAQHVEALKFHGERTEVLERELAELVDEYELLVQAGVGAERERQELEASVDMLTAKAEILEVRLSDERVRLMGSRLSGDNVKTNDVKGLDGKHDQMVTEDRSSGSVERRSESTVIGVMRAEFKKMMREARAEHFRVLKVCLLLSCLHLPLSNSLTILALVRPNKMNAAASRGPCARCVVVGMVVEVEVEVEVTVLLAVRA